MAKETVDELHERQIAALEARVKELEEKQSVDRYHIMRLEKWRTESFMPAPTPPALDVACVLREFAEWCDRDENTVSHTPVFLVDAFLAARKEKP
jgi:hypothetical protein